jgi:hypothetical protein
MSHVYQPLSVPSFIKNQGVGHGTDSPVAGPSRTANPIVCGSTGCGCFSRNPSRNSANHDYLHHSGPVVLRRPFPGYWHRLWRALIIDWGGGTSAASDVAIYFRGKLCRELKGQK